MVQSAESMKQEILQTLSIDEIEEIKAILAKFKRMYVDSVWTIDDRRPIDCESIGFSVSCFNPKQRLYLANLGYRIVTTWDPTDKEYVFTLHLY